MTDKIVVWNDSSEMDHVTRSVYEGLGGFRDDVDWIVYVPESRITPMFCNVADGVFATNYGRFYVKTHS